MTVTPLFLPAGPLLPAAPSRLTPVYFPSAWDMSTFRGRSGHAAGDKDGRRSVVSCHCGSSGRLLPAAPAHQPPGLWSHFLAFPPWRNAPAPRPALCIENRLPGNNRPGAVLPSSRNRAGQAADERQRPEGWRSADGDAGGCQMRAHSALAQRRLPRRSALDSGSRRPLYVLRIGGPLPSCPLPGLPRSPDSEEEAQLAVYFCRLV